MAELKAICISEKKGTQKHGIPEAELKEEWGILGDAHAGKWHRQVSLLGLEQIEDFRSRGAEVDFGAFGENLIVEGCYIPFNWRTDFDERYLPFISFICLAMTEEYIQQHFDEIITNESAIEARLIPSDCTIADLKKDNERCINGYWSIKVENAISAHSCIQKEEAVICINPGAG